MAVEFILCDRLCMREFFSLIDEFAPCRVPSDLTLSVFDYDATISPETREYLLL